RRREGCRSAEGSRRDRGIEVGGGPTRAASRPDLPGERGGEAWRDPGERGGEGRIGLGGGPTRAASRPDLPGERGGEAWRDPGERGGERNLGSPCPRRAGARPAGCFGSGRGLAGGMVLTTAAPRASR